MQRGKTRSPMISEEALGHAIGAVNTVGREQSAHTAALGVVAGSGDAVELVKNTQSQALYQDGDWANQLADRLQKMERPQQMNLRTASSSDRHLPHPLHPIPVKMEEAGDMFG